MVIPYIEIPYLGIPSIEIPYIEIPYVEIPYIDIPCVDFPHCLLEYYRKISFIAFRILQNITYTIELHGYIN